MAGPTAWGFQVPWAVTGHGLRLGPGRHGAASPRLDAPFMVKSQPPVSAPAGGWPRALPDWGGGSLGRAQGAPCSWGHRAPGWGPAAGLWLSCALGEGVTPTPGAGRGPALG